MRIVISRMGFWLWLAIKDPFLFSMAITVVVVGTVIRVGKTVRYCGEKWVSPLL